MEAIKHPRIRRRCRPLEGSRIVWPGGVAERYGVTHYTVLRWEKSGQLPPRDVYIGGRPMGWRPETLDAADSGKASMSK